MPKHDQLVGHFEKAHGYLNAFHGRTLIGSISDLNTHERIQEWHQNMCEKIKAATGRETWKFLNGYWQSI